MMLAQNYPKTAKSSYDVTPSNIQRNAGKTTADIDASLYYGDSGTFMMALGVNKLQSCYTCT